MNPVDRIVFVDRSIPGFGLRARISTKDGRIMLSWILRLREQSGRCRSITIGTPDVMNSTAARKAARAALAEFQAARAVSGARRRAVAEDDRLGA